MMGRMILGGAKIMTQSEYVAEVLAIICKRLHVEGVGELHCN
jgi:hypothetical protein